MATQMFLLSTVADTHLGTDNIIPNEISGSGKESHALGTVRGSGLATASGTTAAGPVAGISIVNGLAELEWISPPVAADFTMSGTITANIWAAESNMSANVAINIIVDVIRANTLTTRDSNTLVRVAKSLLGTEIAVTTRAASNFTVTPTSTSVNRGDRIRVRVYGDDTTSANMATGYTFNIGYNGTSAAADGDTYVSFTENITFESAPAGTVVYLTNTASAVATASVDKEAWTTPGMSSTTGDRVLNVAGWTAPRQLEETAGSGTVVDWFTRPLTAFTLSGMAVAKIWADISFAGVAGSVRCEIARVDNDGTNATVWASWCCAPTGTDNGGLTTTVSQRTINVSGDDLAITDGQRLRIRFYADDPSHTPMTQPGFESTGIVYNYSVVPNGTGDSYITFPQTLTEYASGPFDYEDAATATVDLQASSVELAEYTEAATVLAAIQASGVEYQADEYTEAATATVDLQASGTEYLARELTDSATALVGLQASGTEYLARELTDSATVTVDISVITEITFDTLIDNFTGSDGTIEGRVALNGDTWHVGDVVNIVSNQIGSQYGGAALDGPYGPDVRVSMRVVTPPTGDYDNYVQLSARIVPGALYAMLVYPAGLSLNFGLALTNPFTWLWREDRDVAAGDYIGVEAIGNHIRIYHKPAAGVWTLVADTTDSTIPVAGAIGFTRDPTGGGSIVLDDFGGGTVTAETFQAVEAATIYIDLQADGTDVYVPFAGAGGVPRPPLIVGGTTFQDRSRW